MHGRVRTNQELGHGYYRVAIETEGLRQAFRPGQFFMLRVLDGSDPLLPRAYSIFRMARGRPGRRARVDLLYKVVGRGTAQLAAQRPGAALDLLGPLGNAFRIPPGTAELLLVAGGIGVPPVIALAEAVAASGRGGRGRPGRRPVMEAFLGGRSRPDLLCAADFRRAGARLHVATEDGSAGYRGLVTELLEEHLAERPRRGGMPARRGIYACGPPGMLRRVAEVAAAHGVPCQLSMEAPMGCGIGICMGCAIAVREPAAAEGSGVRYRLCCKDGPVFDGGEIVW